MKKISVLIPTAREPDLLRCALRSVAEQTAVDQIEEVLVAENLGDVRSKATCEEFKQLPIRYILRDPPATPFDNYAGLFNDARAPLVAFLCDDDWWAPSHVHSALKAFERDSSAIGYCSCPLFFASQMPATVWVSRPSALWLASGRPDATQRWRVTPQQVLTASLLVTPFHFSSMVLERNAAAKAIAGIHVHDNQIDRVFFVLLSLSGPLLYDPNPDVFVRWRSDSKTNTVEQAERLAAFRSTTDVVLDAAKERDFDVIGAWHELLGGLEPEILEEICGNFRRAADEQFMRRHGFEQFLPPGRVTRALNRAKRFGVMLRRFATT